MFSREFVLVDKLILDLQEKFNAQYIVRELRAGNNIADVVFTSNLNRTTILFDEYINAYYYFNHIYKHKTVHLNDINISNKNMRQKFDYFIRTLEKLEYINIEGNYITSLKTVETVTENFIAIEAKISDWRAGLEQAIRYKQYADEVYVALSSEHIQKADLEQFIKSNTGLMSVSSENLEVAVKAPKTPVEKLDIQYFIGDRFLKQLKLPK